MEDRPMVCYSTGAIESLIRMLSLPVFKNHPIRNELLPDLESLRRFAVDRFVEGRATDEQIKVWMKQVREMIYDIQDWLDTPREGGGYGWTGPGQPTNKGISKIDEKQIEDFKDQILEARERCTRYGLLDKVPICGRIISDAESSKAAAIPDPRSLSNEKIILVGLDGPKIELDGHLRDERKKQKVVSVFGMEGLGKTTLAMEIYEKLKGRFEFQSFISLGQSPTMRTILREISRQIHETTCKACSVDDGGCDWVHRNEHWTDQELITYIWELLSSKRYFLLVDDIHSTWDWRVIYAALPYNNLGSRILTTTRSKDVAQFCSRRPSDVVYQMKPLCDGDSRRLLFMTTSVEKEERPIDFEEVCSKLSKMCCGMPLAIIVISGLLTWKSFELGPSKVLGKYMLPLLDQHSTSEAGIRKILEICFSDLTLPMRSCFLYLSAFPANYTIMKDCLIRRWAVEGLLPRDRKGDDYFEELITRRLIQPVFDDNDDQQVGCTVHCVIHEFITSLSSNENFVTAGALLRSESFPCDTIRRFSVDCNKQDASDILKSCTLQLLQMRTLTVSGGIISIPDLSAFKLLRVLDIDIHPLSSKDIESSMQGSYDPFNSIVTLSMLEYFALRGYAWIRVPGEIRQCSPLGCTLNVRGKWRSIHVVSPRFKTMRLTSLLADYVELELPIGLLGGMQELEEVSTIHVKSSSSLNEVLSLVCKSVNLKMLGLRFSYASGSEIHREGMIRLLDVLDASTLQSLFLEFGSCFTLLEILLGCWRPTRLDHLRKFVLTATCGTLQEIPQEIASLVQLTHLHIAVRKVDAEGILVLGNLPNLVLLDIRNSGFKERCTISSGAFRCLKVFWFEFSDTGGMWLQLNEGAMPQLRKLRIRLRASGMKYCRGDLDFGIHHLSSVAEVRAIIDCSTATPPEVEAVEAAITKLVSEIPRDIMLEFSREFMHPMENEGEAGVKELVQCSNC